MQIFRPLIFTSLLISLPVLVYAAETPPTDTATPPAEPAPTAKSPEACVALESNADRLSCYDTAFGRPLAASLPVPVPSTPEPIAATPAQQPVVTPPNSMLAGLFDLDRPIRLEADPFDPTISLLDRRWELSEKAKLGTFNIRAYKPVYLLPVFYTGNVNELPTSPNPDNQVNTPQALKDIEAKFQLSFKTKVVEGLLDDWGDVWVGYTQSSHWQVYNSSASRPFRETNYEPEASLIFKTNYSILGWNGRLLGLSLNHQSNGRSQPLSRSWNRAILQLGFERDNWAVMLRPWYRFSEPFDDDDNPDIEDYMGRGDLQTVYKWKDHEFALMLRHSLKGGELSNGAVQFDWSFPVKGALRGYVQVFDGYGESLIDYNHRATYVGLGISLLNWY
jgi:phospholipase A1